MKQEQPVIFEVEPAQVALTWPVMRQLRPPLDLEQYLAMVARMRQTDGFRLAAASIGGKVGAVAGFRTMEMLYCGRILSVDDLVTDEAMRSKGLGKALLEWLSREAHRLRGDQEIEGNSRRRPVSVPPAAPTRRSPPLTFVPIWIPAAESNDLRGAVRLCRGRAVTYNDGRVAVTNRPVRTCAPPAT